MSNIKPGDLVYYRTYLAEVIAPAGRTLFKRTPKWLIEPHVDTWPRRVVKETEIIKDYLTKKGRNVATRRTNRKTGTK